MADNKIIARILKQHGIAELESLIKNMPLTDLQSLLIEIYNQRTESITPKELLEQYKINRFVQPSKLNPIEVIGLTQLALQLLPLGYQPLELSPVSPLGTASVVAPISQKTILTTIRNTEVCSDATNVMALEAALQRKKLQQNKDGKFSCVKLCSSHRLLRTQFFNNPLYSPHFQILSLCIAGRDEGGFKFELTALAELITYFHELINNYVFKNSGAKPQIKFIIFTPSECLFAKLTELSNKLSREDHLVIVPKVNLDENWNYYKQIRFNLFLCDKSTNEEVFIGDGGDTTWTQQLLSDKKERYMISGLGSELLIQKVIGLRKAESADGN